MKNSTVIASVSSVIIIAVLVTFATPAGASSIPRGTGTPAARLSGSAGTIKRPNFYLNFLLTGSILHEDKDHRLTSYDSSALATPGLALRAGGVVRGHHLIGALFQTNWRPTRKVLDSQGGDNEWGEVANFYLGPEYRYQTGFGLYLGGSVGFAYSFVDNSIERSEGIEPRCNSHECLEDYLRVTDDSGIPGVGVRAVVGYEFRIKRTLALNVEVFAGVFDGENEHHEQMALGTYGLALGIGI